MLRRSVVAVVGTLSTLAVAQTTLERAEALNAEGKSLYTDAGDYAAASAKFRDAIALVPDARFYYNLCAALQRQGKYPEALDACDAVYEHQPREDLATKAGRRAAQIRKEMATTPASAPGTPPPVGTTPPTTPIVPPPPAGAPPTSADLIDHMEEDTLDYRGGVGADVGFVGNAGVGSNDYGTTGLAVRFHGDLLVARRHMLGLSAYLNLSLFAEDPDNARSHPLSIVDLGVGAYWHRRVWRSLYVTPFAGLSFAGIGTEGDNGGATYGTFGVRAEGSLEWVFGGGRHAVKLTPFSLNYYFAVAGQIGGNRTPAADFGLDGGGVVWAFTVGYTIRFDTNLFPSFQLE